jgi:hypothetical protein
MLQFQDVQRVCASSAMHQGHVVGIEKLNCKTMHYYIKKQRRNLNLVKILQLNQICRLLNVHANLTKNHFFNTFATEQIGLLWGLNSPKLA